MFLVLLDIYICKFNLNLNQNNLIIKINKKFNSYVLSFRYGQNIIVIFLKTQSKNCIRIIVSILYYKDSTHNPN